MRPHPGYESSLLVILGYEVDVLLEGIEPFLDGVGVVIGSTLLQGAVLQALAKLLVRTRKKNHQIRWADLTGRQTHRAEHYDH